MLYTLTKTIYKLNGKKWKQIKKQSLNHEYTLNDYTEKIIKAAPFFESLGGEEYDDKQGDHVALSPDKKLKVIYSLQAAKTIYLQLVTEDKIINDCRGENTKSLFLKPVYDYHKSFHKKATVFQSKNKIFLRSYNTFIFEYDNKKHTLYTDNAAKCSATTRRHSYEFLAQFLGLPEAQRLYSLLDND